MGRSWSQIAYAALGTAFAILGVLTLLNVAAAWREGGVLLWGASIYAAMDLLIAYGLFLRERWIPHAFALNLSGLVGLFIIEVLRGGLESIDPLFYAPVLGINALLAASLYKIYVRKRADTASNNAGMAFIFLWAIMFCYTVSGYFT